MSDWREAGDAAFRGPRTLVSSFPSDRFGRLVRGQVGNRCDLFPNAHFQLMGSRSADSHQALAGPGVRAAPFESPSGPIGVGAAEVIGAGEAMDNAGVKNLGADTDGVIRLRPEEVLATPTAEVGG